MPEAIIGTFLQADTTDGSASHFVSAYPTLFSSDSDVPIYLYQSLKTIWLPDGTDEDFAARIVYKHGAGLNRSDADIEVTSIIYEAITGDPNIILNDEAGAERAAIKILIRLPDPVQPSSYDQVKLAELRIRYILDQTLRSLYGAPDLPITGDSSITPKLIVHNYVTANSYFKCRWKEWLNTQNEGEIAVLYLAEYQRLFVS